MSSLDSFKTRSSLTVGADTVSYYSLPALAQRFPGVARLPYSLKVLLENLVRRRMPGSSRPQTSRHSHVGRRRRLVKEILFMPARVLLQDFTACRVVDLAAMRDGIVALGGDPQKVNPLQPVELVIDHSVQVDHFGTANAMSLNGEPEYHGNRERYVFLRWGKPRFAISASSRPRPASFTRSTSNTSRAWSAATRPSRAARVFRHGVRDRLAHDDGERSWCGGLGRRRH